MNQVPKASSGPETKKFWSKVKQSSKGLSSSLGNLSLHSEHDGSTETDTIVHKALVNYYSSKGLPFPEWLGVPISRSGQAPQRTNENTPYQPYQPRQTTAENTQNNQRYQNESRPRDATATNGYASSRRPIQESNNKYSLKDIYSKSATDMRSATQPQQQMQSLRAHQTGAATAGQYNSGRAQESYTGSNSAYGNNQDRYSGGRTTSSASNRLKDRAQRQNKATFDTASSSGSVGGGYTSSGTGTAAGPRIAATWRRN